MKLNILLRLLALTLGLSLGLPASATLISRLGGNAYYDDVLDITWQANANLIASNPFGLSYNTQLGMAPNTGDHPSTAFIETDARILTSGRATWAGALYWIEAMNATNYLGYNDWRLPTLTPVGGGAVFNSAYSTNGTTDLGYGFTGTKSELAHMYYSTLGNLGFCPPDGGDGNPATCDGSPQTGGGLQNTGSFQNLVDSAYWTGKEFTPDSRGAWFFRASNGFQGTSSKSNLGPLNDRRVWAVRSGDVAALATVPLPGSLVLMGLGLLGLVRSQRRHGVGA